MKVLMINGSPHPAGCTATALNEVADTLHKHGIETEILYLGNKPSRQSPASDPRAQKPKPELLAFYVGAEG